MQRALSEKKKPAPQQRRQKKSSFSDHSLFVNSIEKGLAVLRAFTRQQPRLTLATVTRITGLDKSAAQRFLYTLHHLGYLRKDEETKQYSLSAKLLEFGYAYMYSERLIERSQPFLVEAHEKTGETVNLAVLDGCDIILISRIPSRNVVSLNIQIGIRIPAIYSASGRVMAARLFPDERQQLIDASDYVQHTPSSVTDRAEISGLIEAAAVDGYAITHSQFFPNDISVAAPVQNAEGRVVGAISVSAPDSRIMIEEARAKLLPAVIEASRKASVSMGAL
jgi:IclR family transcriptional regulator, pca regulon regulatory protein